MRIPSGMTSGGGRERPPASTADVRPGCVLPEGGGNRHASTASATGALLRARQGPCQIKKGSAGPSRPRVPAGAGLLPPVQSRARLAGDVAPGGVPGESRRDVSCPPART